MNDFFQDNKNLIIIFLVLWLVMDIVLIAPIATVTTGNLGGPSTGNFITDIIEELTRFDAFKRVFNEGVMSVFLKDSMIFFVVLLVAFVAGYFKMKSKGQFYGKEHGSSGWAENGEQYRILSRNKGILLAKNNYLPLDKRGNTNVLIVGGSGSGKSTSYVFPNAYQKLGSYVFTDPKGEIYDTTAGFLKKNGYNIKVLNLVNPVRSDGYNPLAHIRSTIDVDIIAHTIVTGQDEGAGGGSKDPYWDNTAEMLLKSLIYYLTSTRPPEEQNLVSCAELVRAADSEGGSGKLNELMSELPMDHPARTNYKNIANASDKTFGNILSTLQSKLGKFDSKEIADVTSTDTIDFEQIGTEKTAVYVMSSDTHSTYNFLLTIFFAQMIQQLYDFADKNGGKLKVPVYFLCDEFANIGQIPDFDKKISTSRSRGISFSVILQNLDQLEAVYKESYETIIGNCDTHVFLGSNSFKTVEYFSKQLGEATIKSENISTSTDKSHITTGYSSSDNKMARALMTPDELRRMDNDLCIIFEKGLKPIKAKKYYYYEHSMIKDFKSCEIDHNDFDASVRGEWRKINPFNLYVEDNKEEPQDLKIESLNDLFADDDIKDDVKKEESPKPEVNNNNLTNSDVALNVDIPQLNNEPKPVENTPNENIESTDFGFMLDDNLNIDNNVKKETKKENNSSKNNEELFSVDFQTELEKKFDELFGPIETDSNNSSSNGIF